MRKPITKEQLETLSQTMQVHLIDVRSRSEYEKQHIPNAINIPARELTADAGKFSKADAFVCICNHGGERSKSSAEYLYNEGFDNAFYLEGGTAGWFETDQ